jgi:aminoglycoside phosphotransferase (APT) family kinase protein
VALHGDASVGNVLRDQAGQARFIDLDSACVGPREWDLTLTGMFYERLGWHTAREYRAFCDTYGVDVLAWNGYTVLADIRELLMVSWLSQKATEHPNFQRELIKRVEDLQRGPKRNEWSPY